jgi:hypothetical protein
MPAKNGTRGAFIPKEAVASIVRNRFFMRAGFLCGALSYAWSDTDALLVDEIRAG